ncbi:vWA domain-containing protein [Streptomyces fructofermentans]|uniref:VWA domain-containing protein n=1 Tax=Streptomyces fructofermentans TaxID=152141 RepID=A0A918U3C8_9ACTN|nr:VWA domain-containing protein [Streptomyces fructofermentans]GGX84992.1 VWA domain-containing protein [Streptomyces fructofermentans]
MTGPAVPLFDRAEFGGRLGGELRRAGVAVTPERSARFLTALGLLPPVDLSALYWTARLSFVTGREQIEPFDRVFAAVFGALPHSAGQGRTPARPNRPDTAERSLAPGVGTPPAAGPGLPGAPPRYGALRGMSVPDGPHRADEDRRTTRADTAGSTAEVLAHQDFAALGPAERAELDRLLALLAMRAPVRRSRRRETSRRGRRVDLRRTLRTGLRKGGEAMLPVRSRNRTRRRKLVLLCDISRSMEPYTRAYLRLFPRAAAGADAEAFVFATRLTRLTPVLRDTGPAGVDAALRRAGATASDWSGGTLIGRALAEFTDGFGRRGPARGAVVVIFSDGWEGEDPAAVGREMARLARLAHRIVWVNPRRAAPGYTPSTGGMAAALPHCDAFVGGHSLAVLTELVEAVAGDADRRPGGTRARPRPPRRPGR